MMSISVALVPLAGHAAEICHRTSDEKSVYMRSLQTDLMVAGLTCNDQEQYNSFVERFRPVLKVDAQHLQGYFKKKHGKAGAEELNIFVTRLANDESERSIQQGQDAYCDNAAKLFQSVLALGPKEIDDFAATLPISSEAPVRPPCTPPAETPKPIAATVQTGGASASPTPSAPAPGEAAPGDAATNGATVETK